MGLFFAIVLVVEGGKKVKLFLSMPWRQ